MSDAADERVDGSDEASGADGEDAESIEALRERVEAEYDFDDFGPAEMASMSSEEWEAVFDHESWITGGELLDRVEADLKRRVAEREVFARVERRDDRLVAYSDEGYATVYADGSVEGHGTVLRDVKPTVALASMESYDVPETPPEDLLPEPQEVPEGSGELGNTMLQVVAGIQVLAGLLLIGGWLVISLGVVAPPGGGSVRSLNVIAMLLGGVVFLAVGVLLFGVVANARLSDKFRAEEYRNRLRAVELEPGERPEFLPDDEATPEGATGIPDEASDGLPGDGPDERSSESADGGTDGS
ncbi:hypothetical protein HZS55_19430 [Halosimplex rubrum]|uniref:DUF7319 domain-containing protein n=1 Tax=Halosimplex rubrum TaxID=869889 RepID=A0A7D5T068_9EURY|nr:hypothetical protein [Halosimplex rubrum]QLH79331.1 hypothetical protein HZS55_19430 [Halosimplex rubrum]